MDYEIRQEQKRKIAGFHMVGPWEHTVKQGFEQLMTWGGSTADRCQFEWICRLLRQSRCRTCGKTPLRYRCVCGREFHTAGQ
ncbi:DNA gyrase inhibitor [Salmonella bongori]|nr:DNA gyrase inhibitor [Salmonella bongori]